MNGQTVLGCMHSSGRAVGYQAVRSEHVHCRPAARLSCQAESEQTGRKFQVGPRPALRVDSDPPRSLPASVANTFKCAEAVVWHRADETKEDTAGPELEPAPLRPFDKMMNSRHVINFAEW